MEDLKARTIRGGIANLIGQIAGMLLRLGTIIVLARFISPSEFGIVAMVTVLTGFLEIFATGGLSQATVQRADISRSQITALFWVNILIGLLLAVLCLATAPLIAAFYNEPRTQNVMAVMAVLFVLNATGVQHLAILQRDLRYGVLARIEIASQLIAAIISIAIAFAGLGYWGVVASTVLGPLFITVGAWIASEWRPGRPRLTAEVAELLRFGGTVTLNNIVVFIAYNLEKVLLGRNFGSEALGLYSRAYQFINLPTVSIGAAVGRVAFSTLSRLQDDPVRFRRYFLKGYTLTLSITVPVTIACMVLADDIILILLGPNWSAAAGIFRYLAPTILVFGIINPLAWLMQSTGLHRRSLHVSLALAPVVIAAYLLGIPYGPTGVAAAFSCAMVLWMIPHTLWCLHGTPVTAQDIAGAVKEIILAGIAAAVAAALAHRLVADFSSPYLRLALAGSALFAAYAAILLIVLKRKDYYFDVVQGLRAGT